MAAVLAAACGRLNYDVVSFTLEDGGLWDASAAPTPDSGETPPEPDAPPVSVDARAASMRDASRTDSGVRLTPGNPLLQWTFDEGAGLTTTSQPPPGLTGELLDGADWVADGVRGSALRLGLTSAASVKVPTDPQLLLRSDMTISAWYRIREVQPTDCYVLVITGGPDSGGPRANALSGLSIRNGRFLWYHETAGQVGNDVESIPLDPSHLAPGDWHHVVAVRDSVAKQVSFYVAGSFLSVGSYANDPTRGEDSILQFGVDAEPTGQCGPSARLDLDEVVFFDHALSGAVTAELNASYAR